jgi:hypothetical protein
MMPDFSLLNAMGVHLALAVEAYWDENAFILTPVFID